MPSTEHRQVLQQAKEGDPAVIRGLLNHKFAPAGISTQVRWQGTRLVVGLAAMQAPDETMCMDIIERGFKRLQIPKLTAVEVTAYTHGQTQPLWTNTLTLTQTNLAIDLAAWLESGSSLRESVTTRSPLSRPDTATALSPVAQDQKYLSCDLGLDNPALIAVDAIKEILSITLMQILPVPDMPDCVLGIYNWRGEMLWIADLNHLLGLGGFELEALKMVSVIVLQDNERTIGLMVQTVGEITPYSPQHLQSPAGIFSRELEPFIVGYVRESSSFVLDPLSILHAPELRTNH